jgi:hypothetical protein
LTHRLAAGSQQQHAAAAAGRKARLPPSAPAQHAADLLQQRGLLRLGACQEGALKGIHSSCLRPQALRNLATGSPRSRLGPSQLLPHSRHDGLGGGSRRAARRRLLVDKALQLGLLRGGAVAEGRVGSGKLLCRGGSSGLCLLQVLPMLHIQARQACCPRLLQGSRRARRRCTDAVQLCLQGSHVCLQPGRLCSLALSKALQQLAGALEALGLRRGGAAHRCLDCCQLLGGGLAKLLQKGRRGTAGAGAWKR